MTATELIRLFHGNPRRTKQVVRCVAHNDRAASLSLRIMKDGIAVRCFAGCSTDEITAAVGIRPRDLFYEQHGKVDPVLRRKREAEERTAQKMIDALRSVSCKVMLYEAEARYYLMNLVHHNMFCEEYHTAIGRARFWNERWHTLMNEIDPRFRKQRVEVQA